MEQIGRATDPDPVAGHGTSTARATGVWGILMVTTLLGWLLAGGGAAADRGEPGSTPVAIIVLAVFKMYLVVAFFMGIRAAPLVWRISLGAWLLGTGAALIYFTVSP